MAVTFTNNWKNILGKLESILETEFKGALPLHKGNTVPKGVNQALQLVPTGSVLSDYNATSETREFSIEMYYYFSEPNVNKNALDQVLRITSRIEALIHDNTAMVLTDSSNCFNCRIETTELNALDDENEYVVQLEWVGQHLGNIG